MNVRLSGDEMALRSRGGRRFVAIDLSALPPVSADYHKL